MLLLHSNPCPHSPSSQFKTTKQKAATTIPSPEKVLINSTIEAALTKLTQAHHSTASNLSPSHNTFNKAAWDTSRTVSSTISTTKTLLCTSSSKDNSIFNLLQFSSLWRCNKPLKCNSPLSPPSARWARTYRSSNHRAEVDHESQMWCIRLVFVLSSTFLKL